MNSPKTILLTIDVEDWFQVENFKPWIPFETWDQRELRVERNVHQLLNLFDSIERKAQSSKLKADNHTDDELKYNRQQATKNRHTKKVHATFFVLGWIAERLPKLVREIHSRGHEVASHGYNHHLCNKQSQTDLKQELIDSKKLLEDITGAPILGFRAPNFSINDETLKAIEDCGYLYDSSYNSFGLHGRYGQIFLNGAGKQGVAYKISENFFELAVSNLSLRNPLNSLLPAVVSIRKDKRRFILPWGGGGYFRLIPYWLFKRGVQYILKKTEAYMFYIHPWEIDTGQPRVKEADLQYQFRHYVNLKHALSKLEKLIGVIGSNDFITCSGYLNRIQADGL